MKRGELGTASSVVKRSQLKKKSKQFQRPASWANLEAQARRDLEMNRRIIG